MLNVYLTTKEPLYTHGRVYRAGNRRYVYQKIGTEYGWLLSVIIGE